MIQHRAVKFASEMGITFAASNGWLHRFLKRYQLKHINLHGEAGDVDQEKVQEKIAQIREQLKEFDVEFIFKMDETGLFYPCFPRGTYVTRQEDAAGVNKKNAAGGDRLASCITSSMTEAKVRASLESVRSYLYANGKDGEYRETQHLLSKTVHSFTHETQVKRRSKEGGELQATLRDM
ncbi:unnamed protein product [Ectocarpus sp. CCAP 1310/34]|nr:unnamed protein product [Ectocarpus sp. CCAP 1310/34]